MPALRRYRAVSLDLWSTCLVDRPEADERLRALRHRYLAENLRGSDGTTLPVRDVERAVEEVHLHLRAEDFRPHEVDPEQLIVRYAKALGATPTRPFPELGTEYSCVGFEEDPPPINPEAEHLVASLLLRNLPIIATTNTARREASWQEFFRARTKLRFQHVVTSCEVGHGKPHPAIFVESARRLGLPPADILHIGDWWELDGQGAIDAGFGSVIYSGLWNLARYGAAIERGREAARREGVPCFQRLDDPRILEMLA